MGALPSCRHARCQPSTHRARPGMRGITEVEAHLEMIGAGNLHLSRDSTSFRQRKCHLAAGASRALEIAATPGDQERHAVALDISDRARCCGVPGPCEKAAGVFGNATVVERRADGETRAHGVL